MVGRVDAACEPVHGVAGPGQPVELPDELGHPLPELRHLGFREPGVADEAPQLPVAVRGGGLPGGDLEVVEVVGQSLAALAPLDDVEEPRRATVEPLVDRADNGVIGAGSN